MWSGEGRWIEPFLGSGVVLFNIQPQRARVNDSNPHIIRLYKALYEGEVKPAMVRGHLEREGAKLATTGVGKSDSYFYTVRDRFNDTGGPLDFLFLNRSCFNGLMRFNSKGGFNVPFCRKPDRFRPAYVTKIVNQVAAVQRVMQGKDWEFTSGDWQHSFKDLNGGDFVYLDPPYVGRHTGYFNQWSEADAVELSQQAMKIPCGFALSMWKENRYRKNEHLDEHWGWAVERTTSHFYHVGSTENLRNEMEEALLIKAGYEAPLAEQDRTRHPVQLSLNLV